MGNREENLDCLPLFAEGRGGGDEKGALPWTPAICLFSGDTGDWGWRNTLVEFCTAWKDS